MWGQIIILNVLLTVIFAMFLQNERLYTGLLTPACVNQYYRIFLTKQVTPRHYLYYHEVLAGLQDYYREVDIGFRIVGGTKISIQDAPFQVLYGKYCGGTLIAPEWVITAAHCKTKETHVYAGSTQRNHTEGYRICAHFLHPFWNITVPHTHDYDYQLILLERPIPVTSMSRPIAIGSIDDIRPGRMVSVTGWGHLAFKKSRMQNLLRRVYVPIMAIEQCRHMDNDAYKAISPRMFCAGYVDGNKDSCQGDSGGPVVVNGKLVGLVSYGVGCAAPNKPGVYANIPIMRAWIRNVTSLPL